MSWATCWFDELALPTGSNASREQAHVRQATRIVLAIAAIGAIGATLGALTPVRGYISAEMAVPGRVERPDVMDHIGCGSLIAPARWSASDGCEDVRFTRGLYVTLGFFVAVVLGLIGLGMWMFGMRRRGRVRRHGQFGGVPPR